MSVDHVQNLSCLQIGGEVGFATPSPLVETIPSADHFSTHPSPWGSSARLGLLASNPGSFDFSIRGQAKSNLQVNPQHRPLHTPQGNTPCYVPHHPIPVLESFNLSSIPVLKCETFISFHSRR